MEFKAGQNLLLCEPDVDGERIDEAIFVRHLPYDHAEVIIRDYVYETESWFLWSMERRGELERLVAEILRARNAVDAALQALDDAPRT